MIARSHCNGLQFSLCLVFTFLVEASHSAVRISDNPLLSNVDGLSALSKATSIEIRNNDALLNVNGLSGLSVATSIKIRDNDALLNVNGLSGLNEATGIEIRNNDALLNLDGLLNINKVIGSVSVFGNQHLQACEGLIPVLGWPGGPPDDQVSGFIEIYSNGFGCSSTEEILASVSGPTPPLIQRHSSDRGVLSLAFTKSTTEDRLFLVTGYQATCESSLANLSKSKAIILRDNTPVFSTLVVANEVSDTTLSNTTVEVDIDIDHTDPTDLVVKLTSPLGTEVVLWDQGNPGEENLKGTFPTTLTSVGSLDDFVGELNGSWTLAVEDVDVGPIVREGVLNSWGLRIAESTVVKGETSSPISLPGIGRGRDYSCVVAPITALGIAPVSDPYTVSVPLELPSVPTITSTDYEDGKIILTVSVTDNGGTDITGYEATCTDGTNTFTGTSSSSPITVSGLTNDVTYTCTVTATNSVGTSSASAATDPIIPEEASTGLPIWLLYQATQ